MNGGWLLRMSWSVRATHSSTRRGACHTNCYPIDSPLDEVDALYAMLRAIMLQRMNSCCMQVSSRLYRGEFSRSRPAHRPAESALLSAIIAAHVRIDPTKVYEDLKALRRPGGYHPHRWRVSIKACKTSSTPMHKPRLPDLIQARTPLNRC